MGNGEPLPGNPCPTEKIIALYNSVVDRVPA